jgi:hypothetical protein
MDALRPFHMVTGRDCAHRERRGGASATQRTFLARFSQLDLPPSIMETLGPLETIVKVHWRCVLERSSWSA